MCNKNFTKIFTHPVNPYVSITGHTNLYVYPGTKNSRNNGGK